MKTLFVLSLLALAWTYAGYPLAMLLWARFRKKPVAIDATLRPFLSVLIPVRDEARVIARKMESVLAQDWPADRMELIVIDDGSRDETAEVARKFAKAHPRNIVKVIDLATPGGKGTALNAGVSEATGELLVLTDARQPLLPGALSALASRFADAGVGAVSGELALRPGGGGLSIYRRLDDSIRRAEAATGSSVGVTGALWALRRSLYLPLAKGIILDDLYQPLCVARQGYRVVIAEDARVEDAASPDPAKEMRRRTRTLAGNLQLVRMYPWLLSPAKNPLFFRLACHKLLRLAAPFALAMLLFANLALVLSPQPNAAGTSLFGLALAGQVLIYGFATVEPPASLKGPIAAVFRICRSFVFLHVAVVAAIWSFFRGVEAGLWRDVPAATLGRSAVAGITGRLGAPMSRSITQKELTV